MTDENKTDETPKTATPVRKTGLSPKEQKLQAMLAKAANKATGAKPVSGTAGAGFSGKGTLAGKKTSFQRKAT